MRQRPKQARSTESLYSRFANRWQAGLEYLGFPEAYTHLMQVEARTHRPSDNGHVLDLGTGTGAMAVAYVQTHNEVGAITLLDNCAEMLPIAKEAMRTQGHDATVLSGEIGSEVLAGKFDCILAAHVIEHTPEAAAALRWIKSRLKTGGRLILSVSKPHWCTALVRWRWGHRAYATSELISLLEQAGFSEIEAIPYPSGPPSRLSCGYIARG